MARVGWFAPQCRMDRKHACTQSVLRVLSETFPCLVISILQLLQKISSLSPLWELEVRDSYTRVLYGEFLRCIEGRYYSLRCSALS